MRHRLRFLFIVLGLLVWTAGCGSKRGTEEQPAAAAAIPSRPEPEAAVDSRPVVSALGDSLTAGLGVDPSLNYTARLQARIDASGFRFRVVNDGVSGDTSAQGLNRLEAVRQLHPAVVIVELGANDGLRGIPPSETRKNLSEIIRVLTGDGAKVVLAGMEMPPNYGPDYTRQFHAIFPELAREYRTALIPFFLQGVGGRPELNQDDGIHPTAQGYDIVADNVWKVLEPVLRSLRSSR